MSGFLNNENLPYLVDKLSNSDNIKITGNKYGNSVGTVINKLIEKSNETLGASYKELRNEAYNFKTGEGSGVDLSDNTLDSFTTFAIEGNTYKNLTKDGVKELVLNPEIKKEGTNFSLDGTSDGGELKWELEGKTLKNDFPNTLDMFTVKPENGQVKDAIAITGKGISVNIITKPLPLKTATEYTIILQVVKNTLVLKNKEDNTFVLQGTQGQFVDGKVLTGTELKSVDLQKYYLTTKPTFENVQHGSYQYLQPNATSGELVYRCMILEGRLTDKEISNCFKGVQGVGEKSRNIFTKNTVMTEGKNIYYDSGTEYPISNYLLSDYIEIKPNTTYSISGFNRNSDLRVISYDSSKKPIPEASQKQKNITTRNNSKYIRFGMKIEYFDKNSIQIEEADYETPYTSHYDGYRINLKTVGKNLFDTNIMYNFSNYEPGLYAKTKLQLKPNTQYIIKGSERKALAGAGNSISFKVEDGVSGFPYFISSNTFTTVSFTTDDTGVEHFSFYGSAGTDQNTLNFIKEYFNIQLEEGVSTTSYEPYKSSEREIILQEQLHGIENVKDRLYWDNGYKIEKAIEVIRIDENSRINTYPDVEGFKVKGFYITAEQNDRWVMKRGMGVNTLTANEIPFPGRLGVDEVGVEYSPNYCKFSILKSDLDGKSIREYLKEKPIVFYRVLKEKYRTVVQVGQEVEMPLAAYNEKTSITQDTGAIKGNLKISNKGYETYNLLPNKEYSIIANSTSSSPLTINLSGVKKTISDSKTTIRTGDSVDTTLDFYGNKGKVCNIRVIEGDVLNKEMGFFEGTKGVGEKQKNLFDGVLKKGLLSTDMFDISDTNSITNRTIILELKKGMYTISFDHKVATILRWIIDGKLHTDVLSRSHHTFTLTKDGRFGISFRDVAGSTTPWNESVKIQIEKGGIPTSFEPYREDKCLINLKTCGTNLFDKTRATMNNGFVWSNGIEYMEPTSFISDYIPVQYNEWYSFTNTQKTQILAYTEKGCPYKFFFSSETLTNIGNAGGLGLNKIRIVDKQIAYIRIAFRRGGDLTPQDINTTQIVKGQTLSDYMSYETSEERIKLEEPLMRLPNGICDEITKDGKLIRRIGKIVLTGEENWQVSAGVGEEGRYGVINATLGIKEGLNTTNQLADKMNIINPYENNINCVWGLKQEGREYIRLRYEGKEASSDDFKTRLRNEPITLWYELSQPSITDIKPLQARLFKNGHIVFDNKMAPVSTYEVAVNKPAQINTGIKEAQKLENRVNALEGLYDDVLLENAHIFSNLEFDFELMKEADE